MFYFLIQIINVVFSSQIQRHNENETIYIYSNLLEYLTNSYYIFDDCALFIKNLNSNVRYEKFIDSIISWKQDIHENTIKIDKTNRNLNSFLKCSLIFSLLKFLKHSFYFEILKLHHLKILEIESMVLISLLNSDLKNTNKDFLVNTFPRNIFSQKTSIDSQNNLNLFCNEENARIRTDIFWISTCDAVIDSIKDLLNQNYPNYNILCCNFNENVIKLNIKSYEFSNSVSDVFIFIIIDPVLGLFNIFRKFLSMYPSDNCTNEFKKRIDDLNKFAKKLRDEFFLAEFIAQKHVTRLIFFENSEFSNWKDAFYSNEDDNIKNRIEEIIANIIVDYFKIYFLGYTIRLPKYIYKFELYRFIFSVSSNEYYNLTPESA